MSHVNMNRIGVGRVGMISWPIVVLTALVVAGLSVAHAVTILVLAGCVALALTGSAGALHALMIATLVDYANPAIIKIGDGDGVLLRIVLVASVVRILPLARLSDVRLLWPVWLFGLVSALSSIAVSPAVGVSVMKVLTLTLSATIVLVAFRRVPPVRLRRLQASLITVGLTVIGLSALTLARPGWGLGLNGGLQGLLDQTQALGVFVAPFAAWSTAGVLTMRQKGRPLELLIAIGLVAVMVLTKARTAVAALIVSLGVVLLSRVLSRRRSTQADIGRPLLVAAVVAVAVFAVGMATGKVSAFVTDFIYKGTQDQNRDLGEAFYATRGGVVQQWQNFLSSPVIGHGFGVYPDGEFSSGVVEFHGIPISAPIEKGFLPTAILEEGGILGATTLILLIAWLGREAWRNTDLRWRAMFVACIGVNLGECVFLAPGGIGMLTWVLLGLAVSGHRTDGVARAFHPNARTNANAGPDASVERADGRVHPTSLTWSPQ